MARPRHLYRADSSERESASNPLPVHLDPDVQPTQHGAWPDSRVAIGGGSARTYWAHIDCGSLTSVQHDLDAAVLRLARVRAGAAQSNAEREALASRTATYASRARRDGTRRVYRSA